MKPRSGVYLSRCGMMMAILERSDEGNSMSYSIEAFPLTVTKLRGWIYLGEL